MRRHGKLVLGLASVAAVVTAAALLPVAEWLLAVVEWVRGAGPVGVVAYILLYAVAVVLFLPASVLTLGAGFVWGPLYGTMIVSPASVLGATLAFLLGRTALRERVASWVAGNPRFRAVDDAVGRQGFLIVFLLRLSPVFPFIVLNYTLGLTKVTTGRYVLASFIGMLPGTFLFAYLGSTLTGLAQVLSGEAGEDPAARYMYWGGLVATLAVTALVTRIATQALRESVDLDAPAP